MSLERLYEHRRLWRQKPILARVYEPWFEVLLASAPRRSRILEVGAGPGFLGEYARERRPDLRWVASDLHPAPWNSIAADACRLPFGDQEFDVVLGLDILHHLESPAGFFGETSRVLADDGRLVLVEPWITPLSWIIYRFFHQEECGLFVNAWNPFAPGKASFDGIAAIPWRLVRDTMAGRWSELGLEPPRVRLVNGLGYILSLGFRPISLLPLALAGKVMKVDRLTSPLAPLFALRAVLSWSRVGRGAPVGLGLSSTA